MQPEKRKRQKATATKTETQPASQNPTDNRHRNLVE
nr:MAG TPA: hypothetical protein [Caudoviricetes sp.]